MSGAKRSVLATRKQLRIHLTEREWMMLRSDAKRLAVAISESQAVDAKPVRKRNSLSSSMLQATEVMEFLSSHYFSFTTNDLAEALGMADTTARRILRTVETVGWVERTDGNLSSTYASNGANPTQHYRTLKRIQRVSNGA